MSEFLAKGEQIIAYDSDSDNEGASAGGMAPMRSAARAAQTILSHQRCCLPAGKREAGRRKLASLGGAYLELCRGTPLSLWAMSSASLGPVGDAGDTVDRRQDAKQRPMQKAKRTSHVGIALQNSLGGGVCSGRGSASKNENPSAALLMPFVPVIERSPSCSQDDGRSDSSAPTTTAAAAVSVAQSSTASRLRTPSRSETSLQGSDGFTTALSLSPAEVSAVELLAHDIDGATAGCWRATQDQLSPCAIYPDSYNTPRHIDGNLHANVGGTAAAFVPTPSGTREQTSSSRSSKRMREEEGCGTVSPPCVERCAPRRIHFAADDVASTPRPSVSWTVLQRYNERVQQRFAARRLFLPY